LSDDLEFEAWYDEQRKDLIDASHAPYRLYRDQLLQAETHLEKLLSGTSSTLLLISHLSASFNAVDTQTTEFQTECEGILADQRRTSTLAEDIAQNLQYYNYLEPITRRLNAPGAGGLVIRSEFSDMLSNLDTCLDYMQAHVSTWTFARPETNSSSLSKKKQLHMPPNTVCCLHAPSPWSGTTLQIRSKKLPQTSPSALPTAN
jgi:hypothetical protein